MDDQNDDLAKINRTMQIFGDVVDRIYERRDRSKMVGGKSTSSLCALRSNVMDMAELHLEVFKDARTARLEDADLQCI